MKVKTKEEYLNNISPENITINKLFDTIYQAYLDGIDEAESKWKGAVIFAMKKQNIKVVPFFNIILNEISK